MSPLCRANFFLLADHRSASSTREITTVLTMLHRNANQLNLVIIGGHFCQKLVGVDGVHLTDSHRVLGREVHCLEHSERSGEVGGLSQCFIAISTAFLLLIKCHCSIITGKVFY